MSGTSRATSLRAPLGESPAKANARPRNPQSLQTFQHHHSLSSNASLPSQNSNAPQKLFANARVNALVEGAKKYHAANRDSQISNTSSVSTSGQIKQCIGPWQLGKTLGSGASARVRLARHIHTGEHAAVKIVAKHEVNLSQAGSLASLDREDARLPAETNEMRRMPYSIEREVAIMKLIQHPNIITLNDIWENRNEIYMVLEYVDKGELFDFIQEKRMIGEEETVFIFRQIISAVGYCHSLKICHRDLKPENILLTKQGVVKIADFGMAALHQHADYKLHTACGSPHYAAPELIRNIAYKGNTVDIWSLGVVLFAMLAGFLPFDVDGEVGREALPELLAKIKAGKFRMPSHIGNEAQSLIRNMLTVKVKDRITMKEIWNHPLIRKYDYLDDLSHRGVPLYPQSPSSRQFANPVAERGDIQKDLVRALRSMWHTFSEEEMVNALLSNEPNEQKSFYLLLLNYQTNVLENYHTDLNYSGTDYHHVKPARLTKTYSTCHFPQPSGSRHERQESRFTVFSNVADTVRSYDPFKASRPQIVGGRNHTTIYRDSDGDPSHTRRQNSRASTSAGGSFRGKENSLMVPGRMRTSRSRASIASTVSTRSGIVRATVGHGKRGVSFNHQRSSAGHSNKPATGTNRHSNFTEVTDDGGDVLRRQSKPDSTNYIQSKAHEVSGLGHMKRGEKSESDDMRNGLAKEFDEIFNQASATAKLDKANLDARPLPIPPVRTESLKAELLQRRKQAELHAMFNPQESPSHVSRVVTHLDKLIQPNSPIRSRKDRRYVSAPVPETRMFSLGRPLHSIYEQGSEDSFVRHQEENIYKHRSDPKHGRQNSAPTAWETVPTIGEDLTAHGQSSSRAHDTIRIVPPSSPAEWSPVKFPAPLRIVKKPSAATIGNPLLSKPLPPGESQFSVKQISGDPENKLPSASNHRRVEEDDRDSFADGSMHSNGSTLVKKTSSWFKRGSKDSVDLAPQPLASNGSMNHAQQPYDRPGNRLSAFSDVPLIASRPPAIKKSSFNLGKLFKKRTSNPNMVIAEDEEAINDKASCHESIMPRYEDGRNREIAPQRNWLAKLFNVKPATKYLCFCIPKRDARRAVFFLLKEWRMYGIEKVQVDKRRAIVFAKLGEQNALKIKSVAFAAEVFHMVDHNNKNGKLSVVRFTQEEGAASSLAKILEHMRSFFSGDVGARRPCILVSDGIKSKMMIQTVKTLVD